MLKTCSTRHIFTWAPGKGNLRWNFFQDFISRNILGWHTRLGISGNQLDLDWTSFRNRFHRLFGKNYFTFQGFGVLFFRSHSDWKKAERDVLHIFGPSPKLGSSNFGLPEWGLWGTLWSPGPLGSGAQLGDI